LNKKYPERYQFVDPDNDLDMFGGGWPYPVVLNQTGGVELQTGIPHKGSCIKHFAMYNLADLPGTPRFGGGIPSMLWKLITGNLIGIHETQMTDGLENWMPSITDVQTAIGKTTDNPNGLTVKVLFKEKATGDMEYLRFNTPLDERN
jgi:hypothetical protein